MPYARFVQAARIAGEAGAAARKEARRATAIVSWHVMAFSMGGGQAPSLGDYLDALGLGTTDPVPPPTAAETRAEADAIFEAARAAFRPKGASA